MSNERFDNRNTAIAQATRGLVVDFLRHPQAQQDADLYADTLEDLFGIDSPLTVLERTITTTGGAQTLTIDAPILGSTNLAGDARLIGIDFGIQLNPNNIPRTDVNMTVRLVNAAGVSLLAREQAVTGTASIQDGNTRQYLRLLCFEQNSTLTAAGAVNAQDGKTFALPRFQRPDPANLATALGILTLTPAAAATIWPNLHQDVAQIVIDIPAGGFAAGVNITVTPITSGRVEGVSRIINSMLMTKEGGDAPPFDLGQAALIKNFLSA